MGKLEFRDERRDVRGKEKLSAVAARGNARARF